MKEIACSNVKSLLYRLMSKKVLIGKDNFPVFIAAALTFISRLDSFISQS